MRRTLQALRRSFHPRRAPATAPDRRHTSGEFSVFRAKELGGTRPVVMSTDAGRDQVASAISRTGWQSFELPLPQVLAAVAVESRGAIYDVGANTGFYALLARHVNRKVPVRAFEPYPPVLELLERNVVVNGNTVDIVAAAVGSESGRATLYVPEQGHGLVETSASLDPEFKQGHHDGTVEVDVVTLDEVNAAYGDETVSFVKIDVEGMEHAVLSGATRVLRRDRPWLVVEVLPSGDLAALEEHRARLGYVDVQLHPGTAAVADRVEFAPTSWNHLWVHHTEWDRAQQVLHRVGLWPATGLRAAG
jgi:FkbM family methyltransferase